MTISVSNCNCNKIKKYIWRHVNNRSTPKTLFLSNEYRYAVLICSECISAHIIPNKHIIHNYTEFCLHRKHIIMPWNKEKNQFKFLRMYKVNMVNVEYKFCWFINKTQRINNKQSNRKCTIICSQHIISS